MRGGDGPAPRQRAVLIYNLAGDPLRGAQVALPTEWLGQRPLELLTEASYAVVTSDNRARYPLPDLPARSATWLVSP